MTRSIADARDVFPFPFQPYTTPEWKGLDEQSVADRLDTLNLGEEERGLWEAMWAQNFNAPASEGGLTQALRWGATSNGDWKLMFEICSCYTFTHGTISLAEAIRADGNPKILFETVVRRINQMDEGVVLEFADGGQLRSRAVVVTAPIAAARSIEFVPSLPEASQAVLRRGQSSQGGKV